MSDSFKFDDDDDFGGFDSGIDDSAFDDFGSIEESNEGGFDNFENTNQSNNSDNVPSDKRAVLKPAIIAIVIGIVVVIGAFVVMKLISSKATTSANNQATKQTEVVQENKVQDTKKVQETTNKETSNGNNIDETINKNVSQKAQDTSGWKSFASNSKISFNEEYVDCIFTVTNIKNYVKVIDSENNLMMKTVVTGNLSGFTGTYELELPYNKGSQLLAGNNFNVKVQLGKYDDKVVVGEIKY